jgi:ribosome maturation factor RimP
MSKMSSASRISGRPTRWKFPRRVWIGRCGTIERQSAFAGRIQGVVEGAVLLEQGRKTHRVPLDKIKRANLDVEF